MSTEETGWIVLGLVIIVSMACGAWIRWMFERPGVEKSQSERAANQSEAKL